VIKPITIVNNQFSSADRDFLPMDQQPQVLVLGQRCYLIRSTHLIYIFILIIGRWRNRKRDRRSRNDGQKKHGNDLEVVMVTVR